MKKLLLAALALLALTGPAGAQGPTFYFPIIVKDACMPTCEKPWRLIEPIATTNYVLNPSFETTGNFAAAGGGVVTRTTEQGKYGLYGLRVQTAADDDGVTLTLDTLTNATHYVTLRAQGTLPANWDWSLDGARFHAPTKLESIDSNWALYGVRFPASEANASTTLYIFQNGAGSGDFYIDGVQVEALSYWTTYCDGDQDGCEWNGTGHAATSTRSAQSRAGGHVRDFWEDYGFFVQEMVGVGAATVRLSVDGYALLPGGSLNNVKVQEREFTLVGEFIADSQEDLHRNRQALIEVLSHDLVEADTGGWQPVRLRYAGADVQKEMAAHYDGGLEAELAVSNGPYQVEGEDRWRRLAFWTERTTIRFTAPDPFFYEVGESAAALDYQDSATFRYVAGRLRSTGQWDVLGPPNVAGTYTAVLAIAEDDTYVYFGGNFLNFDNIAAADNIVRWHKQDQVWSALSSGAGDIVRALVISADGTLYAGGDFVTAGGGAANRIAAWDGVAWSALGAGMDNSVNALTIGLDGTLYAGGAFTTAGGGGALRIAAWNGAAWSALGAGMDNTVNALVIGPDGTLYAGGAFTTAGGGAAAAAASWDGSAWSALGSGLNSTVEALAVGLDGTLYAAGAFTTAGGGSANRIAKWNGTAWSALGSGLNNSGYSLAIGPDGTLFVGGVFTSAGGITLADRVARWNGSSWAHLDIDLPGAPTGFAVATGRADPVILSNYDLWLGYDTTGTGTYAGLVTATNDGSTPAYPLIVIVVENATPILESIRNETTGKILLFDYTLDHPEELRIDLSPAEKSIISTFWGPRPDAILANSDFGSWRLGLGDNDVTLYVNTTGATAGTPYMTWKDTYRSLD